MTSLTEDRREDGLMTSETGVATHCGIAEVAGLEIAGLENDGRSRKGGK